MTSDSSATRIFPPVERIPRKCSALFASRGVPVTITAAWSPLNGPAWIECLSLGAVLLEETEEAEAGVPAPRACGGDQLSALGAGWHKATSSQGAFGIVFILKHTLCRDSTA